MSRRILGTIVLGALVVCGAFIAEILNLLLGTLAWIFHRRPRA